MISWRFLTIRKELDSFHFTTAKATGADVHAHRSTVDINTYSLRVRSPRTASFMVGVAHGVAGNDALVADFTEFAHYTHLLQEYIASKHNVL